MNLESQNHYKITIGNERLYLSDLSWLDRLIHRLTGAKVERISRDMWINESVCADRNRRFK